MNVHRRFSWRLWFSCLLLLLVSRVSAAAAAKSQIAALDEKWRWVVSEHYEVLTNGSERSARQVIEELSFYRASIGQLTGSDPNALPKPIRILIFEHAWDFEPYQPLDAAGRPEQWVGYFVARGDDHYFALTGDRGEELPRTALTGYAHALIGDRLGNVPLWMKAGLAEYLSAYRYLSHEKRVEIGRPIPEHLQYLNSSTHYPLDKVLAMEYDAPDFARDVPRWLFYAKSWLLVHYLQIGSEQRAGALARFAKLYAAGEDSVAALEKSAGCTLRDLENELAVYQKKSIMPLQVLPVSEKLEGELATDRAASKEETAYRLGEYLAALAPERKSEIAAHFAASGKPEPVAAPQSTSLRLQPMPALSVTPRTAPVEARDPRSIDELQVSVLADGAPRRDKELFAAAAIDLLGHDWERAKPHLPAARRAMRELLAEDPDDDEGWQRLNRFYEAEQAPGDTVEGIAAYEMAIAELPDAVWLLQRWAEFALTIGESARARAAAESALTRSASGEVRAALETVMVRLDQQEADRLAEAGQEKEARRLLEARLAASTQRTSRDFATSALTSFQVQSATRAVERQYHAAVALVNAQKVEQGGEALWRFIHEHPQSPLAELAKRDLEQVDDYLARKRGVRPLRSAPPPPSSPPS